MPASGAAVRIAKQDDLDAIKRLFDAHRIELGFVLRPALASAVGAQECLVATMGEGLVGCVHFHHRRDGQTTLYHIAVAREQRAHGIGEAMIAALKVRCIAVGSRRIFLKCPAELPANAFYQHVGFELVGVEEGRHRPLNHWNLSFSQRQGVS